MDLVKERVKRAWRSDGGGGSGNSMTVYTGLLIAAGAALAARHHSQRPVPWTARREYFGVNGGGGGGGTGGNDGDGAGGAGSSEGSAGGSSAKQRGKNAHRAGKGGAASGGRGGKNKKKQRSLRDSFDDLFDDEVFVAEAEATGANNRSPLGGAGTGTESGMESVLESDIEGSGLVHGAAGKGPLPSPYRIPVHSRIGPNLRGGLAAASSTGPAASLQPLAGQSRHRVHFQAEGKKPLLAGTGGVQGQAMSEKTGASRQPRGHAKVNRLFFQRVRIILNICIPTWHCKELLYIVLYSVLLILRTFFSMSISELSGYNAEMLVSRNWPGLMRGITRFFLITIPTSTVNSGLKYIQQVLALALRQRLSMHVNQKYIRGVNFYKATNLGGQSRIDSADQRVTNDIEKFTTAFSEVYGTLFKPILDVSLFTYRLRTLLGWQGPALMYGYFGLSAVLKKLLMPPLGRLGATESALEGQYRNAHQRLIDNSEEIALYEGSRTERAIINQLFRRVYRHTSYLVYLRAWTNFSDGLLIKYWATIVGYAVMASPMIFGLEDKIAGKDSGALTADYIRNTSYLMGLAASIGQIVLVGNKFTAVAGYTARVSELLEMVQGLDSEVGQRPFPVAEDEKKARMRAVRPHGEGQAGSGSEVDTEFEHEQLLTHSDAALPNDWLQQWHARREQHKKILAAVMHRRGTDLGVVEKRVPGGGVIRLGDRISFEGVDIVSPDGKVLAEKLTFEIPHGENVMVTGPNGSGKSSLSRLLGELWPVQSGAMTKPSFGSATSGSSEVMFVPQRPYMVLGTLRDQLLYPHQRAQAARLQVTDGDLMNLLDLVDPNRIITTAWSFDTVRDWAKTFSGGQRQRISMARLFYHKPRFAVLDECTNAMSDEIEDKIYEAAKALHISLFTVSHRVSLQRHHEWQLLMHGNGKWEFKRVENDSAGTASHSY
jgi:ATP-binding cassette, subfamily D (ALD), member 3